MHSAALHSAHHILLVTYERHVLRHHMCPIYFDALAQWWRDCCCTRCLCVHLCQTGFVCILNASARLSHTEKVKIVPGSLRMHVYTLYLL